MFSILFTLINISPGSINISIISLLYILLFYLAPALITLDVIATITVEQCFPTFFVLCTPWAYLSYHEYPHVDDSQKV